MNENKYLNEYLKGLGFDESSYLKLIHGSSENDCFLLNGAAQCTDYLKKLSKDSHICIAGDYDADGVTSTVILYYTLKRMGFKTVNFVIPNRIRDGYGLKPSVIDRITANDKATALIITCDNGIASYEAVEYAAKNGIDVIVTDHHSAELETIEKLTGYIKAFVHPRYVLEYGKASENYDFADISGAQTVYKLFKCLSERGLLENNEENDEYLMQLAAISIISDVMPVASSDNPYNENREFFRRGIQSLSSSPNWHLDMLMQALEMKKNDEGDYLLDESSVGFYLAPAINAAGRLASAETAVKCLTAPDRQKAARYASLLVYLNESRKEMKKKELAEASDKIDISKPALVYCKESLHEGLIGIIAGNMADTYHKPSCVFTLGEFEGKTVWKGSARSDNSLNLFEALTALNHKDGTIFASFGGHAGAAGLSVWPDKMNDFIQGFNEITEQFPKNEKEESVMRVHAGDIMEFSKALADLKPLGNGLPQPTIQSELFISQIDLYYKSGHVKLSNMFGIEIWLYNFIDNVDADFLRNFRKVSDNVDKRSKEMPLSEAQAGRSERWKAPYGSKPKFDTVFTLDYGWNMMNKPAPVLNVKSCRRI